jgi:ABC-type lipoprotein release transport system permease subunit
MTRDNAARARNVTDHVRMLLALAWRNLWVNRRRTLSALAAVAAGVTAMLLIAGLMNGMSDRMLEGVTGSFLGHVQLHHEGFRERHSVAIVIADADQVLATVRATDGVQAATGRLFGLANVSVVRAEVPVSASVAALLGVEPDAEQAVTDLATHVVEGRWLQGDSEVVLGAGLAKRSGARVGDSLVLGPGEAQTVVGILRSGMDGIDGRTALMTRARAAKILGLENQVHEIAIRARDPDRLDALVSSLRARVPNEEALAWYDIAPEIRIIIVVFSASPIFMSFILFLAVAFGILNTMLMTNFERTKEFGLMMALGTRPRRIVALVLTESALLGLVGTAAGAVIGLALVGYWSLRGFDLGVLMGSEGVSLMGVAFKPVLWPRVGVADLLKTAVPVAVLALLAGLWPAVKASRTHPADALRNE